MKKYKNFINESKSTLRDRVLSLLMKAKDDCYDYEKYDNHNESESIKKLKEIIDEDYTEYDLGCSYDSIEMSALSEDYIMNVLDLSGEQLMMMIYNDIRYDEEIDDDYKKHLNIVEKINKVFDIDSVELLYYDEEVLTMYSEMDNNIRDIYEVNISEYIYNIRKKLFFEFTTDTMTIYPNLIESNEDTITDAIYKQCNDLDISQVGYPNLNDDEYKEIDNLVIKSFKKILEYCQMNKDKIIDNVIKKDSPTIPNLYSIKSFGGIFLEKILDFEYQKSKILNSKGEIINYKYERFEEYDLLNKKMIDYKNMKIQTKKFKI